jgi:hypothetical protein
VLETGLASNVEPLVETGLPLEAGCFGSRLRLKGADNKAWGNARATPQE